ncbi:rho GTPase-activating protein 24-like isoform X2 [Anguilla rostrata]|uniref:rho GTPase-activating protein 24-like isoform X2 n=1 Tax=Anguilla rostrata TaxID=7938 RepID=UPI0030D31B33
MPVTAALSSLPEVSPTERTAGGPAEKPGNEGQRERDKNKATRDRKMPENKQALSRSGSYLSGATYRRIKRVLSFRRRVFGQRLEETVVYERRYGEHAAPLVVEQCVAFIRERGLQEVGLFRQPGQATLVKELQDAFDAGEKPSFDSTDVHTVASLLKLYLRELPEPVVPFSRYQDFLLCGKHILIDRKQGLLELKGLLHELPVANFNLLHYICQFLNEVQSHSSSNKMSTPNLATVFGPNILRPKAEDPESIIGGAAVVQQLMSELIREFSLLFVRERDAWPGSSPFAEGLCMDPAAQPHCSCPTPGPASEGLPLSPRAAETGPPQSPPGEAATCRQSETEPRPFDTPSPGSPVDPLYENFLLSCYQTPPPPPSTPPPPPPPPPRSPPEVPTATAGQGCPAPGGAVGWVSGGGRGRSAGGSLRERRRASDAHESTLSVYDNMDAGGSGARARTPEREDAATSADSSSWSSCELLVEDAVAGGLPSLRTDPEERRVNSPASSALTDAPLSSGSSEVFLPSAPPDTPGAPAPHPPSNAMHCILAGLRQQMARQRLEFESRIKSLEQRNEALLAEVSGLRASLEQQRRWYSVVEIKMRNAERGRADADRRNAALQAEMEQFFDTFGELGGEARKAERIVQSF